MPETGYKTKRIYVSSYKSPDHTTIVKESRDVWSFPFGGF